MRSGFGQTSASRSVLAVAGVASAVLAAGALLGVLPPGGEPLSKGRATAVAASSRSGAPTVAAARVALHVGRCQVDPVALDGRMWTLPEAQQFGWGGGVGPITWQGAGVAERLSAGRARYHDDGGAVLDLVPATAPVSTPPACV